MRVVLILAMFVFGWAAGTALAQDISIEVELSSKRIPLGSTAQLTVTVNGATDIDPVQIPPIDGVDVQYVGPSTRVSVVNGQYSSSKAFTYSLFPHKEGQFQIPAFSITVSGRPYTVESIPIEVFVQGNGGAPAEGLPPATLEEKIFLVVKAQKQEVYVHEGLPVKVMLFVSGIGASDIQFPQIDNVGFTISPARQPKQYQQMIDGVGYDIVEFDLEAFPTRPGDLILGPAQLSCHILVQGPGRSSPGGRGSLFDDDFFNSFFGGYEKRPLQLKSEELPIKVLPLPEEGKPLDFSGAVGQYSFNVSVTPTEVKVGDPLTLRMTVLGKGNPAAYEMPSLPKEAPFKIYEPQVFEKEDIKKTEQVIIPESPDITEVPAIRFSYFDPQQRQYKTITQGPFPIKVKELEEGEGLKFVGAGKDLPAVEPEEIGQDIVFIKSMPGKFRMKGRHIYNTPVFYVVLGLAALVWLVMLIFYHHSRRIQTDTVYARRLQAPRQARNGIAKARGLMGAGNKEGFYDTLFKTIQAYLGNKLHLSSGAVTFETVKALLAAQGVEPRVLEDVQMIFEECDMIRYASADITLEKMNSSLQRLAHVIDHLERFLR